MHPEARAFLVPAIIREFNWRMIGYGDDPSTLHTLDIGGRDINGTMADILPGVVDVLDLHPGPNVTIQADATSWRPLTPHSYDLVLCTEVFEHAPAWRDILTTAAHSVTEDGLVVVTCASNPRGPHSGVTDGPIEKGEHYENVGVEEMVAAMKQRFRRWSVEYNPEPGDLYCWGRGPK